MSAFKQIDGTAYPLKELTAQTIKQKLPQMTTTYNRSQIYQFSELKEQQQQQIINDYGFELSDCHSNSYVIHRGKKFTSALPLDMFMRCEKNNFTHGVYSTSAFDGFFLTFNKGMDEAVIAHKYF